MIKISPNAVGDAKIIRLAIRFGSAVKLYLQIGNESLIEFLQCKDEKEAESVMDKIEEIKDAEKVGFNPPDKNAEKK